MQVRRPLPKKPEITLKERLEKKRLAATKKTYLQTYRSGVNDEESVVLTDDLTAVGVYQTSSTDWSKYRGAYRGWACNYNETKIVVPARRHERVVKQGLDVIDGMMTLDAQKLTGVADIELYAAVWVVQKRGNNVETVRDALSNYRFPRHVIQNS